MKIELLVTPGCPSQLETEKALKAILSELAPAASLRTIIVGSQKKAEALRFPGSPTVRIDGEDLEPEADKSLNYGLGWRTYSGESGRLSKVPPRRLISQRIGAHARIVTWENGVRLTMGKSFSPEERKWIKESITAKYGKFAVSPEGNFKYPTGRAGLEGQDYDPEILKVFPEEVLAAYCGVGNPFSLGAIKKGETILDVGCGAGIDTLVAAMMAGPEGKVVGIDLTREMLDCARANLEKTSLGNVTFQEGSAEDLPFQEASFDLVISNGVFNLVPDKAKALKEVFRVLKSNGRLMLADQIITAEQPVDTGSMLENWSRWQGGALPGKDFLAMIHEAGFTDAELVAETGFNSSPVTKGVLFRARRPTISNAGRVGVAPQDLLGKYQEFFNAVYAEGAIDRRTKHLIALGASLAAGCDPWTRYCLAVARELGATEDELKEIMAIAMTVGATKIQILQESALDSMPKKKAGEPAPQREKDASGAQESRFAWTTK